MGARLYLERFVWFDSQIRKGRYPNATKLALASNAVSRRHSGPSRPSGTASVPPSNTARSSGGILMGMTAFGCL